MHGCIYLVQSSMNRQIGNTWQSIMSWSSWLYMYFSVFQCMMIFFAAFFIFLRTEDLIYWTDKYSIVTQNCSQLGSTTLIKKMWDILKSLYWWPSGRLVNITYLDARESEANFSAWLTLPTESLEHFTWRLSWRLSWIPAQMNVISGIDKTQYNNNNKKRKWFEKETTQR